MQINRSELQKVRVKLSRDALTIQKEGVGSISTASSQANHPEVRLSNSFPFYSGICFNLKSNLARDFNTTF